ncbi:cytochrome c oxidase subunit 3 [uncultured Photobacterium sp.]|uniref:cytochrome c oxidase subunit 3 n=1 Tax=uncultured Photobacterium sp. TaxID=173973 RepID=UPI002617C558|nr:cytochrome c oxidase subunit 3 [uncultured Photobacterium sp.]
MAAQCQHDYAYSELRGYALKCTPVGHEEGAAQFGSSFFMITGFHGLHVSIGVLYLLIVAAKVWRGNYKRSGNYEFVEIAGLYWHFVDYFHLEGVLRWILIFMALKAGLIASIFMHMLWERLTLVYTIFLPPLVLLVFVVLMASEADYIFQLRELFFSEQRG